MSALRVCFVAERATAESGWGRYVVEVARGVRDLGIEPVLATADPAVDPAVHDVERHVVLQPLLARRFDTVRSLSAAHRLRRVLSSCQLVHGVVEGYMPLVAVARRPHQPFVQTAHGTWAVRPFDRPVTRALFRQALRRVDLLVCQSRYTRDRMASHVSLPPHVVLSGGVHASDFDRPSGVMLPEWSRRGPVALGVGMVKARKGIHIALEAVALARQQHPTLQLVVIGRCVESSAYVRALRDRASALGMNDAFHLVGSVSAAELTAWYHAADVFTLLPVNDGGSFEGLGLVYLEAGAAGTPSIGTRDCGAEDAIVDGDTGILVAQADPVAAAEALSRLLADRPLRDRMGAAARARADILSWTHLAQALVTRYQDLLSSARMAGRS